MTPIPFTVPEDKLAQLLLSYPNTGKNSDVGKLAVAIVKEYFLSIDCTATFVTNKKGVDLQVSYNGLTEDFEIKGTADESIAWSKLKVSSQRCYDKLEAGMKLIRVSKISKPTVDLYFLEYGKHFILEQEPRWSVKRIANLSAS
ncbi:hypothetical protein ACFSRY_10020 [Pontibacter locisalis]|uniref:Protein NO VEIN C-terminal domain-containing protein n=1 Tax=Pontibacter locisalis TaxID=1719035 RepID=A0ABW5IMI1_9BACT